MSAPLTDEHVVPLSLGGTHVLKKASCRPCAAMTSRFERGVARELWGDARTAFAAPTRRKKKRNDYVDMPDGTMTGSLQRIPAAEFPAGFLFYKMSQSGFLSGMPEHFDLSKSWEMVIVDDDERRDQFFRKYGKHATLRFRNVPTDFGRLIAKIGYCNVLTEFDNSNFNPICLPYIRGHKSNVSFVVGSSMNSPPPPEKNNGYSVQTLLIGTENYILILAIVRLYANLHSPEYHVVVGEVNNRSDIDRVFRKNDNDWHYAHSLQAGARDSLPHWFPRVWPGTFRFSFSRDEA